MVADTVRVWTAWAPAGPQPETLLDPAEQARARSFVSEADRWFFVFAHTFLRRVAGHECGLAPELIRWWYGPEGKPLIAGERAQVNLSHAGRLVVVATTASRPVGVDVQDFSPQRDPVALARRFFTPGQAALVASLPEADARAACFARLWSRKEAVVKAGGGRLAEGFQLPVEYGRTPLLAFGADRFRVADVPAPAGFRCAVACAGPDRFEIQQVRGLGAAAAASVPVVVADGCGAG